MSRYVKQLIMEDLKRRLKGVRDLLFVDLERLNATEATQLRLALRRKQIRLRVVKNTLARRVFAELGLREAAQFLTGPSAVVWGGESIVELAREITDWAKKIDRFRLKGGLLQGTPLTQADVEALSQMPSREQLLGRLVGLLLGCAQRPVQLLQGVGSRLLGQIRAHAGESS
jgi:large subunit ribosomal protein L10